MLTESKPFQYEVVGRALEETLASGKLQEGSRLPSEPELARRFSVNRRTVRRALVDLEKAGKIVRRQGQGTFVRGEEVPCREILFVGGMEDHLAKERFVSLQTCAQRRGHRLYGITPGLSPGKDWRVPFRQHLRRSASVVVQRKHCEAVLPLIEEEKGKPALVIFGDSLPPPRAELPAYHILLNRADSTAVGMRHLLSLGHRRIALLTIKEFEPSLIGRHPPPDDPGMASWLLEEYAAYRAALIGYGIREWEQVISVNTNAESEKTVARLKTVLASKDRPTAFFCDMDYRARFLYQAAAETGLSIPGDLSVVGVFDTPWCQALAPALTSVNPGNEDLSELVLRFAESGPADRTIACRVEPCLVERESCAPPPVAGRVPRRPRAGTAGGADADCETLEHTTQGEET